VRSKSANLEEAGKVALRFSLAQCAKDITCPIYIVAGPKTVHSAHPGGKTRRLGLRPCVLW